jgi:hypothetical protein
MSHANKIPLYFNYIGVFPQLLEAAKNSISHPKIEVRINAEPNPVPFTKCLNKILADVGDAPCFFFMHYDAEITDNTIFDKMLRYYQYNTSKTASVCACNITDLLILFNTKLIREIGGWDEQFSNSFMELDLRNRIIHAGYAQPIIYPDLGCPNEMIHKASSSLRNHTIEGNICSVYDETYKHDIQRYYEKYPEVERPDYLNDWLTGKLRFSK